MATPAPARQQPPPQQQEGGQDNGFASKIMKLVQQVVLIYLISTFVKSYFGGQTQKAVPKPVEGDAGVPPAAVGPDGVNAFAQPPVTLAPLWPLGSVFDMYVQVSTTPYPALGDFAGMQPKDSQSLPKFVWRNITFGDWKDERVEDFVIDVPQSVQHNASLWLHSYLTTHRVETGLDAQDGGFTPDTLYHFRKPLTRYMKKPRVIIEKNLLGGDDDADVQRRQAEADAETDVWLSYWHPNVTLTMVSDPPVMPANGISGPTARFFTAHPSKRDATGTVGFYYPVIFPNDFWLLRQQMAPINTTTPTLPLRITYHPLSSLKFNAFASFSQGFDEAANKGGGAASADLDEIKRMLIETNVWLLITTAAVSVLHMLFEMLAFSSDIAHWRKRDELVGVSVRTIILNVVFQIITGLYLWDNSEDTSWMILFTQTMGVAIEAWKITKAVDISLIPAPPGSMFPYKIDIKDKHVLSEDEKKTQEYDRLAFRYVSYVTIPLLAGYTVYSLMYETHKGWYSFIITTLSSFVYMFGFVQLVPQLIINYKLKSVAHMPWKAMVYKTLSTVVDDFFAFIIKMPWLHRLACFRDDVVFLILLYQRWIYRIDYSRANEYGQLADGKEEKEAKEVEGVDKKE
ncbi:hypothetical protein M407DRAFT_28405 [Tulasnella calospora MUT 4182]|uniref:Cleft lip and palate associated transmembrane protein n=1 Tax=Tulasnella calospora MUT 4182 TaxID=1051891 RepID=A0A0C3Q1H2_9AGAM|nr:hypothetical protein M407DRAFT_28405 [Tulasnella calospora MUT 4182]